MKDKKYFYISSILYTDIEGLVNYQCSDGKNMIYKENPNMCFRYARESLVSLEKKVKDSFFWYISISHTGRSLDSMTGGGNDIALTPQGEVLYSNISEKVKVSRDEEIKYNWYWASRNGDLDLIRNYVENGIFTDIDYVHKPNNSVTALQNASRGGYNQLVEYLLKKGAKVNGIEGYLRPIDFAIQFCRLDTVKLLEKYGGKAVEYKDRIKECDKEYWKSKNKNSQGTKVDIPVNLKNNEQESSSEQIQKQSAY